MPAPFKLLLKNSIVFGIANIIQKLVPFIIIPIITAYLGQPSLKLYDVCFIYAYLFSWLVILGQDAAASVFYFDEKKENFNKRHVLSYAFWIQIFSLLVFFCFIFPFKETIAQSLFPSETSVATYWLLALNIVPGHILMNYGLNILLWKGKRKAYLFLCLFYAFITIGSVVYMVLVQKQSIITLFYIIIFTTTICGLAVILFLHKNIFVNPLPVNYHLLKKLLWFGLPFALTSFFYQLIPSIDRYFLLKFGFIESLPQYSLAAKIGGVINMATGAFVLAFTPYSMKKIHDEDAEKEVSYVFRLVSFIALMAVPVLLLFKYQLIQLFADLSYPLSVKLLPFFFFGWVFDLFTYFSMLGMYKSQQSFIIIILLAISTALIVALNFFLVPYYGVFGAAVSFTITKLFLFLVPLFYLKKYFKLTIHKQSFVLVLLLAMFCSYLAYIFNSLVYAIILISVIAALAYYIKKTFANQRLKNYFV